jgi:hypothetical protein
MANVLAISLFVLALVVMLACLWTWTALMLPGTVARAAERLQARVGRCAFVGLMGLLLTGLGLLAFAAIRVSIKASLMRGIDGLTEMLGIGTKSDFAALIVQYVGWLVVAPVAAAFVVGGAAFVRLLAERMGGEMEQDSKPQVLFASALIISLALSMPFIGWLFCLPAFLCLAIGAGWYSLFARQEDPAKHATPSVSKGKTAT